ncbi:MAG TPA: M24 family metallopeptidase [Chloroflexota bacterium]
MPMEITQTWDDDRLRQERVALVQQQMREQGVGALYIGDGTTVRYLLNIKVPSVQAFVPPSGDVLAFVRPRDAGYVKLQYSNIVEPPYDSAMAWGPEGGADAGANKLAAFIEDLMAQNGVAGEALGVDTLSFPALAAFNAAEIKLTYGQPCIEMARAVKTQDEIAIYRTIGDQYTHTVRAFREALRPGISENELAGLVVSAWYEAGGEEMAQLNVCAGENMNPWRRWPTQRAVRDEEFVGLDLHGFGPGGLRGDASRTFYVGEYPTTEQRDLYKRAHDYLLGTIDAFHGGRTYADALARVPKIASKYEAQMYNYHVAHAIGMSHSGYPEVNNRKAPLSDTLKPNQVLSVECFFAEEGATQAVKLEEMIVVRDGAPEILTLDVPFDERFI